MLEVGMRALAVLLGFTALLVACADAELVAPSPIHTPTAEDMARFDAFAANMPPFSVDYDVSVVNVDRAAFRWSRSEDGMLRWDFVQVSNRGMSGESGIVPLGVQQFGIVPPDAQQPYGCHWVVLDESKAASAKCTIGASISADIATAIGRALRPLGVTGFLRREIAGTEAECSLSPGAEICFDPAGIPIEMGGTAFNGTAWTFSFSVRGEPPTNDAIRASIVRGHAYPDIASLERADLSALDLPDLALVSAWLKSRTGE